MVLNGIAAMLGGSDEGGGQSVCSSSFVRVALQRSTRVGLAAKVTFPTHGACRNKRPIGKTVSGQQLRNGTTNAFYIYCLYMSEVRICSRKSTCISVRKYLAFDRRLHCISFMCTTLFPCLKWIMLFHDLSTLMRCACRGRFSALLKLQQGGIV